MNAKYTHLLTEGDIRYIASQDPELEVIEETADGLLLYDAQDSKELPARFPERLNAKSIADLIHISSDVPKEFDVNKDVLADYLWNVSDKNAFVTLNEIVILWDDEFSSDPERERLFEEYSDEFALELSSGFLGQLWFDRNIVAINLKEITDTSREIAEENADIASFDSFFQFDNLVIQGLLTTALHDLRHLQMDTNIFRVFQLRGGLVMLIVPFWYLHFPDSMSPVHGQSGL